MIYIYIYIYSEDVTYGELLLGLDNIDVPRSIQTRLALRSQLHCKSFQWYLQNVYPELKKPDGGYQSTGVFKQGLKCLDTMGHHSEGTVGIFTCHGNRGNQVRYHEYSVPVGKGGNQLVFIFEYYISPEIVLLIKHHLCNTIL